MSPMSDEELDVYRVIQKDIPTNGVYLYGKVVMPYDIVQRLLAEVDRLRESA